MNTSIPTDDPSGTDDFFTARELAKYLKVSLRTIRRLKKAAKLPPEIKVGRSLRWPKRAIRQWYGLDGEPSAA